MRVELTEVVRIEEHHELSLGELAELSRLTEADVCELLDCGVITPVDARANPLTFTAECLLAARAAWRLREELELDVHGAAVALALIERIRQLESELKSLLARGQT